MINMCSLKSLKIPILVVLNLFLVSTPAWTQTNLLKSCLGTRGERFDLYSEVIGTFDTSTSTNQVKMAQIAPALPGWSKVVITDYKKVAPAIGTRLKFTIRRTSDKNGKLTETDIWSLEGRKYTSYPLMHIKPNITVFDISVDSDYLYILYGDFYLFVEAIKLNESSNPLSVQRHKYALISFYSSKSTFVFFKNSDDGLGIENRSQDLAISKGIVVNTLTEEPLGESDDNQPFGRLDPALPRETPPK